MAAGFFPCALGTRHPEEMLTESTCNFRMKQVKISMVISARKRVFSLKVSDISGTRKAL